MEKYKILPGRGLVVKVKPNWLELTVSKKEKKKIGEKLEEAGEKRK